MPTHADTYQTLLTAYNLLSWYKKMVFWVSAPRLSWGLFGSKEIPDESQVNKLIKKAKASRAFKTEFEQKIYSLVEPESNDNEPPNTNSVASFGECADVAGVIAGYLVGGAYGSVSRFHREADTTRKLEITNRLLLAVAYGMESQKANVPVDFTDAGHLFKSDLYAKELLQKSPEFLLEKGDVRDWAGRTFKDITVFKYALWAKDFKMIEMMLGCIPATSEGDAIRAALLEQYKQVTVVGGGLTYTHIYDRYELDALGIPYGRTTTVTEVRTENHFNITPLCDAYKHYGDYFNNNIDGSARTKPQQDACWTKLIGRLQCLLPIHILQRYCDPNTPFVPLPQFNRQFKRYTKFYNFYPGQIHSLFRSTLFPNFALMRYDGPFAYATKGAGATWCEDPGRGCVPLTWSDLKAIRMLDKVSTNEIEKIIQQLSQPRHVGAMEQMSTDPNRPYKTRRPIG